MLMIDWVTAKIPFHAKGYLAGGNVLCLNSDGETEWETLRLMPVMGSYDSRIAIKTSELDENGDTCQILLSGNPVKFLQGHNIFGTNDLINLMLDTVEVISSILGIEQPDSVMDVISWGSYKLSRIDINQMHSVGSRDNALAFLANASQVARTRHGTAITKGSTVYFNKSSRRWTVKQYYKHDEVMASLAKNKPNWELPDSFRDWLAPMVRTELTLKSRELFDRNLQLARNWVNIDMIDLFEDYLGRIVMAKQIKTEDLFVEIQKDSKPLAATYQLWLHGHDVRNMLSKPTFYRQRKALLEYGVDISIPCPPDQVATHPDAPDRPVIELVPAVIPDWVYGTPYFYEPKKRGICNRIH